MDSETLTYIVSIILIFLVICAAMILAVAYWAIDVFTDYYGWMLSGF